MKSGLSVKYATNPSLLITLNLKIQNINVECVKMSKCFICGRKSTSFILGKRVCKNHFNLIKNIKRDKAFWEKIKNVLESKQ